MKRSDTEKRQLQDSNPTGTFLIRESENQPGNYSLTLSVRDSNTIKHYHIIKEENCYIHVAPESTKFSSLEALVSHYQKSADGLCCQLSNPYPKEAVPPTLGISYSTRDEWEIERTSFQLVKELWAEEFSEMWEGLWNGITPVAVKTLKVGSMSDEDFLAEAQIMKKLKHKNIIQLYAVCTRDEPLYILMEPMKNGRLKDYLREGEGHHLELPQLIDIGGQIACGMAYFECQHCIHRDLAARNVLVGERNVVKIANFGRARQLNDDDEYVPRDRGKYLIKWMAPEAIMYSRFSTKSDIWSFGIVLWEVVTRCGTHAPYPGMYNKEVMTKVVEGYLMPRPSQCPDPLYQIMLTCWKTDPKERPTFESLQHQLENYFVSTDDTVSDDADIPFDDTVSDDTVPMGSTNTD